MGGQHQRIPPPFYSVNLEEAAVQDNYAVQIAHALKAIEQQLVVMNRLLAQIAQKPGK